MKKRTVFVLSILAIFVLGCSLTSKIFPQKTTQTSGQASDQPLLPVLKTTPDPSPVSFNDGLASLNSYQMTILFKSVGPDPAQSTTTQITNNRSNDADSSLTQLSSSVVGAGGQDPSSSITNIYRIGNDSCTENGGDWSWSSSTPEEVEMQGLVTSMIGLTPLIDKPTFVAAETINGIPSNHFNFKVSSLGVKSGSVVNINQGDYWLAKDGQYIVKYVLIIEMSKSANSEIMHEEVSIDVNQINQPVTIAFPQGCLDAKAKPQ